MRISRVFFICLLLFVGITISRPARAANADIKITQVGAYPTSTHEWVEIFNGGDSGVSLSEWKFLEGGSKHAINFLDATTTLRANSYGIIAQNAIQFLIDYPNFNGPVFDSSWGSLKETGEEIGLEDASSNLIYSLTYNSTPTTTPHGIEIFLPSVSTTTNVTSTEESISTTSSDWSSIKINEIFPHPSDGKEWIELFNAASTSLDLAGGSICDGRTGNCEIVSTTGTIEGFGYKVFYLNSAQLNNGGDSVILFDPTGKVVDNVTYGEGNLPKSDQALARATDGTGAWVVTITPTPENSNIITPEPTPAVLVSSGGGGGVSSAYNPQNIPEEKSATSSTKKSSTSTTTSKVVKKVKEVTLAWKILTEPFAALNRAAKFDATATADPRGGKIEYYWDWGDHTTGYGETLEHTYSDVGTYDGTIVGVSDAGTTGTTTFRVKVFDPDLVPQVFIDEVFPNPSGADTNEFVEIFNTGQTDVDISGWKLSTGDNEFVLPASSTIPTQSYRVFYRQATHLVLPNSGGEVSLENSDNQILDRVIIPAIPAGSSLVKSSGGWLVSNTPTPGEPNSVGVVLGEKIAASQTKTSKSDWVSLKDLNSAGDLSSNQKAIALGTVTVLPNIYSKQSFYITDSSGALEIYFHAANFPPLNVGDQVRVLGTISAKSGIARLKISNANQIVKLGKNSALSGATITLDALDDDVLGELVTIKGEVTSAKRTTFYVDDGTGDIAVTLKKGSGVTKLPASGTQLSVTGMIMKGAAGLELWPRNQSDIVEMVSATTKPKSTSFKAPSGNSPYLLLTVGGGGACCKRLDV